MADYLKIPELARRLDVSEKTARRYVKAGTLPSTFIGGAYRVTEEDLDKFLHRSEVKPEAARPKAQAPPEPEASAQGDLEQREPKVETGGANLEGTSELGATGRIIHIASPDLQAIIRGAVRGELSEEEAMAAAHEKAETT